MIVHDASGTVEAKSGEPECTCEITNMQTGETTFDENCFYHRVGGPMYFVMDEDN